MRNHPHVSALHSLPMQLCSCVSLRITALLDTLYLLAITCDFSKTSRLNYSSTWTLPHVLAGMAPRVAHANTSSNTPRQHSQLPSHKTPRLYQRHQSHDKVPKTACTCLRHLLAVCTGILARAEAGLAGTGALDAVDVALRERKAEPGRPGTTPTPSELVLSCTLS
jgi:hypothetical protein